MFILAPRFIVTFFRKELSLGFFVFALPWGFLTALHLKSNNIMLFRMMHPRPLPQSLILNYSRKTRELLQLCKVFCRTVHFGAYFFLVCCCCCCCLLLCLNVCLNKKLFHKLNVTAPAVTAACTNCPFPVGTLPGLGFSVEPKTPMELNNLGRVNATDERFKRGSPRK